MLPSVALDLWCLHFTVNRSAQRVNTVEKVGKQALHWVFVLQKGPRCTRAVRYYYCIFLAREVTETRLQIVRFYWQVKFIFEEFLDLPWHNRTGWLGVKHQFTCLLTASELTKSFSSTACVSFLNWIGSINNDQNKTWATHDVWDAKKVIRESEIHG